MKLSKQLGSLIGITVLGLILLGYFALTTIHTSLIDSRKHELQTVLSLATTQAHFYVEQEKQGKISRQEAEQKVIELLSNMNYGSTYMWARDAKGLLRVHVKNELLGKPDLSRLPNGKLAYDSYIKELKTEDIGYIANYIAKPGVKGDVLKINAFVNLPDWNWLLGFGVYMDDVESDFWSFALSFILIGVAVFALIVIAGVMIARSIYKTLGGEPLYAMQVTGSIADGNLNQIIEGKFESESLLGSISRMQSALKDMVGNIKEGSEQLTIATNNLNQQMQTITQASQNSSDATHSTAAAIQELSSCIDNISVSARNTATNSEVSSSLAIEGESQVQNAAKSINDVSAQIITSTKEIAGLQKRSIEIGNIVKVIRDIAEQTNLLALNAAIEAARAGEQGRGFAVVADEVRTLASRTATATSEITETITIIQAETEKVAKTMQSVLPKVDASVSSAEDVSSMLTKIRSGTDNTLEMIRDVAHSAEEQNQATESLAQHVEEISAMVASTAEAVSESRNSMNKLDTLAISLHKSISFFKV
ncbi:methyl-accepting chemotaxis protein [Marinomonas polaris]|uniref:methyl-accepting chemotaxis protein n=1 Tax=Marinomonas polaris TaxID=293552 RepID=UPI003F9984B5